MVDMPDTIDAIEEKPLSSPYVGESEGQTHFRKKMSDWMSYLRGLQDKESDQKDDSQPDNKIA